MLADIPTSNSSCVTPSCNARCAGGWGFQFCLNLFLARLKGASTNAIATGTMPLLALELAASTAATLPPQAFGDRSLTSP